MLSWAGLQASCHSYCWDRRHKSQVILTECSCLSLSQVHTVPFLQGCYIRSGGLLLVYFLVGSWQKRDLTTIWLHYFNKHVRIFFWFGHDYSSKLFNSLHISSKIQLEPYTEYIPNLSFSQGRSTSYTWKIPLYILKFASSFSFQPLTPDNHRTLRILFRSCIPNYFT